MNFYCLLRLCQDNRNRSNQKSKFDFLAIRQQLGKIDGGQQKLKLSAPTDNQIYAVPANQFSPSPGTTLTVYVVFSPKLNLPKQFGRPNGTILQLANQDQQTWQKKTQIVNE